MQMNDVVLAVGLTPDPRPTRAEMVVVQICVLLLRLLEDVRGRLVGGKVEHEDGRVEVRQRHQLTGRVDRRCQVDRCHPFGEAAHVGGAVVLLDVLSRSRNRDEVKEADVVHAERTEQRIGRALLVRAGSATS